MLNKFHMNNPDGLNTVVRYSSLRPTASPKLGYKGKPTTFRKFLATTSEGTHDSLIQKHGDEYAQALIDGDPEVDMEAVGQFIKDTQRIFLSGDGEIMHCPPEVLEVVLSPKGEIEEERIPQDVAANVNDVDPITWTKKRMKRRQVVTMFSFRRSLQIHHIDGLSYEFLYNIAKDLHDKDEMVLIGSGPRGRAPLIFRTNGTPYRGFLEGRIRGKEYQLLLHLSNLQLKLPEE
jgi:hypothetical protein